MEQHFGPHVDESSTVDGAVSRYTMLVYLTGAADAGLRGGATVFYDARDKPACAVDPVAGRALFHRHGAECMVHEGARVEAGVKYVLRSDVMFSDGPIS